MKTPKNIQFPIRLSSQSVTSISINTQILIFWLLFQPKLQPKLQHKIKSKLQPKKSQLNPYTLKSICTDFFISQMKNWPHNTGKGLSEFLTQAMLKDLLKENPDLDSLRDQLVLTFSNRQE